MAETMTKRKNILILFLAISLLILLAVGLDLINPKNNKIELNNENNQKPQKTDSVSVFKKVIGQEEFCGGVHQEIIDFSVDMQGNIYIIGTGANGIIQISSEGKVLKNFYNEDLRCKRSDRDSEEHHTYITAAIAGSKNYLYLYLQKTDGPEEIYKVDINTGNFEEIWNSKMNGFEGSFAASWDTDDNDNLYFIILSSPYLTEQKAIEVSYIEVSYSATEQQLSKNILDKDNNIAFWQITKNNIFRHDLISFKTHDNSLYVYDLQNNFIRKFEPEHLKQKDDIFSWFGYDGNFYIIRKQPDNTFILERTDTDNNVLVSTQAKDYTRFNRNDVKMEIGFDGKVYIAYVDREQGIYGVDRYEF